MKYIKFLKKILNRKEKFNIFYISILMVINTLFELLSIGIILPIVTILLKKETLIYFEKSTFDKINIPNSLKLLKSKSVGDAEGLLLEK